MITINFFKRKQPYPFRSHFRKQVFRIGNGEFGYGYQRSFYLPKDLFYGLEYIPQVSNETNDIVYYEI